MHGSRSTGGSLTTRGSHVVSVTAPSLPLEEETVWKQPAIKGLQERNTPLDAESKGAKDLPQAGQAAPSLGDGAGSMDQALTAPDDRREDRTTTSRRANTPRRLRPDCKSGAKTSEAAATEGSRCKAEPPVCIPGHSHALYAQEHVLICASPEPSFAPSRSRSAVIANGSLLPRFILTLTLTLFLTLIPCHCPLPPSSLKAEAQPRPPNPTTISALSSPHLALPQLFAASSTLRLSLLPAQRLALPHRRIPLRLGRRRSLLHRPQQPPFSFESGLHRIPHPRPAAAPTTVGSTSFRTAPFPAGRHSQPANPSAPPHNHSLAADIATNTLLRDRQPTIIFHLPSATLNHCSD
ncbi:uncharacterized protein PAN0_009d3816 [Moesziomyces antarcticus]|uniref:Uncharacterized protein n=1 Tax=Pseudozyma antarctica TaxID=84753 RepID=A0A081CG02_PSEA2|nr:uncharacterized protein PAN0_009d3816 [Moesziomyces antarcticus]GAK65598.1 hypothetical protein PAN0_009d3816 [Moesziomyces antarcticus]